MVLSRYLYGVDTNPSQELHSDRNIRTFGGVSISRGMQSGFQQGNTLNVATRALHPHRTTLFRSMCIP